MRKFVLDVLGFRAGNVIDLRDASKAELEAVFGTRGNYRGKAFNWVRPGRSDLFVFYSGHGVPGLKNRRGFLLPVDADPDLVELNGYPVDLLDDNLAKIPARSVTVYLDACFSGGSPRGMLVRATSGLSIKPRRPEARSLTVLTVGRGDQFVSWDEQARHGLFSNHLLKALYGAGDQKT